MNLFSRLIIVLALAATLSTSSRADEPKWTPLFDGKSLDSWKFPNFAGQGDVKVVDGSVVLDMGNDITGINYTGEVPKMDYEIALEAKRVEGSDFFCALTFPVGASFCTFVVGGWGGAVVGISSVNSDDASENETSRTMKFEKGRWYKIRVKVTKEKIEAWIDDAQMVNLELDGKRITMRPGEIELSKPFGIATYRTRGAMRDIRLRKL